MANLPTAYASQRFGRKGLDFYAVEGDVVGADPRARNDERRLEDIDGARHTVRLMDKGFELEPGQVATVLRMQPGPARRSRPVAVINHDTSAWCRTHPGAEGLLARAGVSRAMNWALTMVLFALAAIALVWPFLRAFLVEVDAGMFSAMPAFNVGELAVAALPALSGWSFSAAIAPLTGPLADAAPALAPFADMIVFGGGVFIAALGVYLLRSWRLLWAPLFVGALGAVSLGYGGVAGMVEPALSGLAIASVLFLFGGLINRIRDGARLEARIAVLADHLLRQGPQDAVVAANANDEAGAADQIEDTAPVAAAAASLREPTDTDEAADPQAVEAEAEAVDTESDPSDETPEAAAEPVAEATAEEVQPDAAEEQTAGESEPADNETAANAVATEGGEEPAQDAPSDEAEPESVEAAASEAVEGAQTPVTPAQQGEAAPAEAEAQAAVEPEASDVDGEAQAETEAGSDEGAAPATVKEEAAEVSGDAEVQDERKPEPADLSADTTPAGLDPEEAERLRTDPRYASRAIVLPPPPPMPGPSNDQGEGSGEAVGQGSATTLKPSAPLPDNVIPIFAPSSSDAEASEDTRVLEPADGEDEPRA